MEWEQSFETWLLERYYLCSAPQHAEFCSCDGPEGFARAPLAEKAQCGSEGPHVRANRTGAPHNKSNKLNVAWRASKGGKACGRLRLSKRGLRAARPAGMGVRTKAAGTDMRALLDVWRGDDIDDGGPKRDSAHSYIPVPLEYIVGAVDSNSFKALPWSPE